MAVFRMDARKHTPHRNDIWWTRLTDAAVGLEMGAEQKVRPCVVVSADWLNARRPYVVVVPVTHYTEGKESTMARWAASIHPEPHRSGHTFKSKSPGWRSSIIDAAQLWTVHHDDIVWGDLRGRAELSRLAEVNLDSALQTVLGGCIRLTAAGTRHVDLSFQDGDILEADLPGMHRLCLVVSSASVDFLRENIRRAKTPQYPGPPRGRTDSDPWPLGHITVVPLVALDPSYDPDDPTLVRMKQATGDLVAHCRSVFTIDWRARNARRRFDSQAASVVEMSAIRDALRTSLDLR